MSCAKLLFAAALMAYPLLASAEPKVHEHNGVSYVSGGVGDDERHAIEALSEQFDFKLMLALNGEPLAGDAQAQVRIVNSKSATLIDTITEGPLFFAKLPAGTYTVICSLNDKQEIRSVTVIDGKQEQLAINWPKE
jgi:hypothetical protein